MTTAPDHHKSRAAKEFYAARLGRMEFEDRDAKLVSGDEITILHLRRISLLRERICGIPALCAERLANVQDVWASEDVLDAAIFDALAELSGVLTGRLSNQAVGRNAKLAVQFAYHG